MQNHSNNSFRNEAVKASFNRPSFWYVPLALIVCLTPFHLISSTLFHTLVELFAIGIAMMSFVVAWNTYLLPRNQFTLYLGIGYFWVGVIDLCHTLTFENLVGIPGLQSGMTIQFWILARFLEAFVLLSSVFMMQKICKASAIFMFVGLVAVVLLSGVFAGYVPIMFVAGEGLTSAKVNSEYLIIAVLLVSALAFQLKRSDIETKTRRMLFLSIGFTILAELSFTAYSDLDGLAVFVGHIFKLLSFWLIYCLLVESALLKPIYSLYKVIESYDSASDETVILDQQGTIYRANTVTKRRLGETTGERLEGKHCHALLHDNSLDQGECPICISIENNLTLQGYEFFRPKDEQWYEASLSRIVDGGNRKAMVHSLREITKRKHTEQQVKQLNRLYLMLSEANKAFAQLEELDALLQRVCDIGVNQGEFKMVWIGIIEGDVVRPTYYAGIETGYLKEMKMRVDDSDLAKGPVGRAAKSKQVAYVNSVSTDPDFWPWRDAALRRGYGSLAAVPIVVGGRVIGLFTLYAEYEDVFDIQTLAVLQNLGRDLSSALYQIEQEKQKQLAVATIRKLSRAVEQSINGIMIVSVDGVIEYINEGYTRLTGYDEDDLLGQSIQKLREQLDDPDFFDATREQLSDGEPWQGEVRCKRKVGNPYWALMTISPIFNKHENVTHYVINSSDNSALHDAQDTIKHLAFYDPLTGLANRRLLIDRLKHAIAGAHRHEEMVVVMLCDLDNFKTINDSLGHDAGDQLLKVIASNLVSNVREDDTVARLGGDEFVVILDGIKENGQVIDIAGAILAELEKPVDLLGNQVVVSSSIGIAMFPQDGDDPDTLLRNADLAMYHAKEQGKNRFQFYRDEMNEKAKGRLDLEQRLRTAFETRSLYLVYQPQVDLDSKRLIGFEALLRWQDGDTLISPSEFILLAEETGMIGPIGRWVIEQAIHDWNEIKTLGFSDASMAINVSAFQFRNSNELYHSIQSNLNEYQNLGAQGLIVEVTESTLINNVDETANTLGRLKELGVSISIDDFGTGYSSLYFLKRFPIDQLKIDQSFVRDLLEDENDQAIVSAIIAIAQKLDIKVVAEGVEEDAQSAMLLEQGCKYGQGFYYHAPMTLEQIQDDLDPMGSSHV